VTAKQSEHARLWMMVSELADRMGVSLRLEELAEGEGYQTRSGMCRIGGRMVAFVDGRLPIAGRARQLAKALSSLDLESVHMLPALRAFMEEIAAEDE